MADLDKVIDLIDDDEVVQVTADMIGIPSITANEGMGMVNYMEKWFKDLGVPVRLYPTGDGRANFFADLGATEGPGRYMFNGHMDIKPVDGMIVDPYAAEIRDGKMYGRGTCDMKGGIAGVMCAIKAMVRAGVSPKGGITFFSDIEEEFAGGNGYYWAKREGMFDGYEGLISCEPTLLEVQLGNRGAYVTSFETKGRSAHSGLAHKGINAVQNMCRFIEEFQKLPYLQVENEWFGKCTLNFERIQGGLYLSAVPDHCTASVDSRIIPETPPELVHKQVHDLMARLNKDEGLQVSECAPPEGWRPPQAFKLKAESIPADHALTKRVASAVTKATGDPAKITACPAITIAMVLIEMGIPAIICGPGSIEQAHTEDEWVEVAQLPKAARTYAALMAGM